MINLIKGYRVERQYMMNLYRIIRELLESDLVDYVDTEEDLAAIGSRLVLMDNLSLDIEDIDPDAKKYLNKKFYEKNMYDEL